MILRIRNSKAGKATSILMSAVFLLTIINPFPSYGLTGGPVQPEFSSFVPIGTSDMVDLTSGDFSYNIPLMDVGGYPLNLAYQSGITMDQEASWVGLGWTLSTGQINRQMRGLPDDFKGDTMTYDNNLKPNYTVGGTFKFKPHAFGLGKKDGALKKDALSFDVGFGLQYNSYEGPSLTPSAGVSYQLNDHASVAFNVKSTPDGFCISPSTSLSANFSKKSAVDTKLGLNAGVSFNSRQGVKDYNMSTSANIVQNKMMGGWPYAVTGASSSSSNGSVISAVPNTYTPTVRGNFVTENGTFNASFGTEIFGAEGDATINGYHSVQSLVENQTEESAYGYDHTHEALPEDVLDFNREKDGNFSVNSTNLPITNYTYDLYSVQGQGVSGMFRPYRSQVGYVHDNRQVSGSEGGSGGAEIGVGQAAHGGGDAEVTKTESTSGLWSNNNNALASFTSDAASDNRYEEVYYKNVGDLSVDEDFDMYGDQDSELGGYGAIRMKLGGLPYFRNLQNSIQIKDEDVAETFNDYTIVEDDIKRTATERVNRNQNILKVTHDEADNIGYGFIQHTNPDAKGHHTAGFIITRDDAARYVYGKALYNYTKEEVTFAIGDGFGADYVSGNAGTADAETGLVSYTAGSDNSIDNTRGDHYYNKITTPDYAHTFLITSILSADYSDVDGVAGPSVDDLGSYTKFEYRDIGTTYKWRVPYLKDKANYNEGLKTDPTDDKASYVYGEKETSYIQKIETKTHVALFYISPRLDARGVDGENGSTDGDATTPQMYKLDKIELYSRGELYDESGDIVGEGTDSNGNTTTTATPIKTVHFEYNYDLCQDVPNNYGTASGNELSNNGGKLTLKRVYFTYRNSNMGEYSDYEFTYGYNPDYTMKGYDIWGCYKPNSSSVGYGTTSQLPAPEFNYVDQDANADTYAAAWSLTQIELPSGGKISVDYEADDYRYVQNKEALQMFKLAGAGDKKDPVAETIDNDFNFYSTSSTSNGSYLYGKDGSGDWLHADYLYFEIGENISASEFRSKYLNVLPTNEDGDRLIYFRTFMNMTKKGAASSGWTGEDFDYVTGYFILDDDTPANTCETFTQSSKYFASVKMKHVHMNKSQTTGTKLVNPISKASWHFGRKYLSKYIYGLPELDGSGAPEVVMDALYNLGQNLKETFVGANGLLRDKKIGKRFIPAKSWIRLGAPPSGKKGGGCRVKEIKMSDEWATMISETVDGYTDQNYGQTYTYELEDGTSSGVAMYEPVGCKENPFVQPVYVNIHRTLAPDEDNFMEMPFGESFFPNPKVTYSRVSVQNLERVDGGDVVKKNATGKVVTEHYTSKDYPTIVDQTMMEVKEDHNPLLLGLLHLNVKKHLTLSQGYVVHLNDMDGKMKAQYVYAEGQEDFISGTRYIYDLSTAKAPTGTDFTPVSDNEGRLDNKVNVLDPNGVYSEETMGVEIDVINDFREMRSVTNTMGVNVNTATFWVGVTPITVPMPIPDYSRHEDRLRMSTMTKVINSFGILRETQAYDAGATVHTRNLVWDSETGDVLVTETVNEYGDKYYAMNFPAHWFYSGMGLACHNSGLVMPLEAGGSSGYYTIGTGLADDYFEAGDQLLAFHTGTSTYYDLWVKSFNVSPDTDELKLIDEDGDDVTLSATSLNPLLVKVIRSGHRNQQKSSMASVTLQENPVDLLSSGQITTAFMEGTAWDDLKLINAGAVEFSDHWIPQCECGFDPVNDDYNEYRYNAAGVWRALKSWLYLADRYHTSSNPHPRNNGFYKDFSAFYYYDYGGDNQWEKDETDWTYASEVTKFSQYGFELENKDALDRYSAAQYGYNVTFPMAVGANGRYQEIGFDGFEDYFFDGCTDDEHFGFRDDITIGTKSSPVDISVEESHTGKHSLIIGAGGNVKRLFRMDCGE